MRIRLLFWKTFRKLFELKKFVITEHAHWLLPLPYLIVHTTVFRTIWTSHNIFECCVCRSLPCEYFQRVLHRLALWHESHYFYMFALSHTLFSRLYHNNRSNGSDCSLSLALSLSSLSALRLFKKAMLWRLSFSTRSVLCFCIQVGRRWLSSLNQSFAFERQFRVSRPPDRT